MKAEFAFLQTHRLTHILPPLSLQWSHQYLKSTESHSLALTVSLALKEGLIVTMSAVSRASRTKTLFTPLHILISSFTPSPLELSKLPLIGISHTSHLFLPFIPSSSSSHTWFGCLAGERMCTGTFMKWWTRNIKEQIPQQVLWFRLRCKRICD